jgi:hypothetical protein
MPHQGRGLKILDKLKDRNRSKRDCVILFETIPLASHCTQHDVLHSQLLLYGEAWMDSAYLLALSWEIFFCCQTKAK